MLPGQRQLGQLPPALPLLDQQLRQRASDEHIPTSRWSGGCLRQAMQQGSAVLSPAEVEDIARRATREELRSH